MTNYIYMYSNFESQKSTGMLLLDVKAAFDTVWHEGLIYKMIRAKFPSELMKIVQFPQWSNF